MVALRDEGMIAGVGISAASRAQVEQAIAQADIVCVQNAFSLVDQRDADVVDLCHDYGIAYVPYFPLGSTFPGMAKVTENAAVRVVAAPLALLPLRLVWRGSSRARERAADARYVERCTPGGEHEGRRRNPLRRRYRRA